MLLPLFLFEKTNAFQSICLLRPKRLKTQKNN